MDNQIIMYGLGAILGIFVIVVLAYLILMKKMRNSDVQKAMKLRAGTEENAFSADVIYQKLYMLYIKTPFFKKIFNKSKKKT